MAFLISPCWDLGFWTQALAITFLAVLFKLSWDTFFSTLSTIPGPLVARSTDLWRAYHTYRGRVDATHVELHRKYGDAVRIGPNCVSISDPNLIRTIYSTRNPWKKVP